MKLLSSIIFSLVLLVGVGFVATAAHAQTAPTTCTSTSSGVTCTNSNGVTTTSTANGTTTTALPVGCTSTSGFSTTSGMPCNSTTTGTTGALSVGSNGYINGCTSTSGTSTVSGYPCNTPINGVIYAGNGQTVVVDPAAAGISVPTTPVDTSSPGLPTTGAENVPVTLAVLLASGLVAFFGVRYSIRHARQ